MPHKVAVDIRRAAMDLLARREHSMLELRQKLSKRFESSQAISQEIQRLNDEGLQCDLRFSSSYIRSKSQRGVGPVRIKQELRQKGLTDDVIARTLAEADVDWWETLEACTLKKFGTTAFDDQALKAKCIRFLAYRGFASDMIYELID